MKKKIFNYFTLGLIVFSLTSCSNDLSLRDDIQSGDSQSKEIKYENIPFNQKGKIIEKFGKGISKALQNQEFRRLLKKEALKKFNKDTDVLYHTIKNKPINSSVLLKSTNVEFLTLHEFLIPFFENEAELIAFENQLPLLTIFVPELPEESFSAELWDVNDINQIPDVALRLDNITYTPVIGRDDFNYLVAPEDVPGWPIVVLKENERVVSSLDDSYSSLDTRIIDADGTLDYKFLDNNFDPIFNSTQAIQSGFEGANDNFIPQNLKTAYDVFENDPYSWHRDNIYYGLTPTNTSGPINGGKFREHIATFKMAGDPTQAFTKLSDSFNEVNKDPSLKDTWQRSGSQTAWTDGGFEIMIDCSYGAKSSNLGASVTSGFGVAPNNLFEIAWDKKTTGWWFWRKTWYKPRITATKTLNTAVPNGLRLEFSTWDLNNFANHWKFIFKENDASTTTTNSETRSSKFNTNFSLEPSTGLLKKIGLKFGASYETTQSNTFTVVINTGSDLIGEKDIQFYDNPINKENGTYKLRKFSNAYVEFSLAPLQVQF
jgi:hypothetical protein